MFKKILRMFYENFKNNQASFENLFTKLIMAMNSIISTILTTNFLKSDHINSEIQAMITYIPFDKILGITFQGRDTSDPTVVSSRQQLRQSHWTKLRLCYLHTLWAKIVRLKKRKRSPINGSHKWESILQSTGSAECNVNGLCQMDIHIHRGVRRQKITPPLPFFFYFWPPLPPMPIFTSAAAIFCDFRPKKHKKLWCIQHNFYCQALFYA